ncbi:hypothetical protein NKJ36_28760 [Mesorhizobium sp. M0142]
MAEIASTEAPPALASTAPERRMSISRRFSPAPKTSLRSSAKSSTSASFV